MVPGTGIDPIQVVYAVVVLNSAILGSVLWRYRERSGAVPLLANVLAAGLWAGSLLVLLNVDPGLLFVAFLGLLFLGVVLSPLTLLVFTLQYTGRERFVRPSILAALSIEPILTVFFAVVNPGNLFFRSLEGSVDWGIAFWIHTAYSYVVLTVITGLILGFLYRSRSLYRGQSAALLAGTLVTWLTNVAYLFGPVDVDTSPIGLLVAGLLYAVAIVRYRLTDVVPIARDRVLETVSDGVFVVDERDRLIDLNPVGRTFLADTDGSPIGSRVESLFADSPEVQESYRTLTATPAERETELAIAGNHYHVRTTPIDDGRDRHVGWLFIVRDITERKRRETRLERQNERLERFADVVSHDLRNPLNVADGYLELARETDDDDEYLAEIEASHDRMETIIEDVLAMARDGADVTEPEPVALGTLAEKAWDGVDTGSASVAIDADVSIMADPDRVRRLLENLFRNAIDHATEGTDGADLEIAVGTIDAGAVEVLEGFYVEDDGIGIPACRRDQVFEGGYTTDTEGTGFGLSIVEQIATAHGWTAAVAESDGGGARFEFRSVETAPDSNPSDPATGRDLKTDSPSI